MPSPPKAYPLLRACCLHTLANVVPTAHLILICTTPPPLPPGRLNVLANVVRKPMRQIFTEFSGKKADAVEDEYTGSGDVKYHLGTSYHRPTSNGKMVYLSLVANPRWAGGEGGRGSAYRVLEFVEYLACAGHNLLRPTCSLLLQSPWCWAGYVPSTD